MLMYHVTAIPVAASSTIAVATGVMAQTVIDSGEPPAVTTALIFAVGLAAIGALWRSWRTDVRAAAKMRRADDKRTQEELDRLRARVDQLTDELIAVNRPPAPAPEPD